MEYKHGYFAHEIKIYISFRRLSPLQKRNYYISPSDGVLFQEELIAAGNGCCYLLATPTPAAVHCMLRSLHFGTDEFPGERMTTALLRLLLLLANIKMVIKFNCSKG